MISLRIAALTLTSITLLAGCGTMPTESSVFGPKGQVENLTVSSKIPAAEGTVKASDGKNNNTLVDLKVLHLAPPQKVNPLATTYVVWERELNAQTPPRSLGALMVDKDLTGKIETVTALHRFEVFVTAEASGVVNAPSGDKLLSAMVKRN